MQQVSEPRGRQEQPPISALIIMSHYLPFALGRSGTNFIAATARLQARLSSVGGKSSVRLSSGLAAKLQVLARMASLVGGPAHTAPDEEAGSRILSTAVLISVPEPMEPNPSVAPTKATGDSEPSSPHAQRAASGRSYPRAFIVEDRTVDTSDRSEAHINSRRNFPVGFEVEDGSEDLNERAYHAGRGGLSLLVGRVLTAFSSIASSGLDEEYRYEPLPSADMHSAPNDALDEQQIAQTLRQLVPGLVCGRIRAKVVNKGKGTQPVERRALPNGEGFFSTQVSFFFLRFIFSLHLSRHVLHLI
jgi:hypothetical protein